MASVNISGGGGLDTRDFARFAKALRRNAPLIATDLRRDLRGAGEIVAAKARQNAEWSTRIPGTIKVRTSRATVSVIAGGAKAPDAAPYEHKGRGGNFSHPVFGNQQVWVSEPARPFLKPALEAGRPAAEKAAVDALDRAVARVIAETEL
jgi:hypothetical protein